MCQPFLYPNLKDLLLLKVKCKCNKVFHFCRYNLKIISNKVMKNFENEETAHLIKSGLKVYVFDVCH